MADDRALGGSRVHPRAAELAGRHVLIVDDDDQVRLVLGRFLKAMGVEADTAAGGAEAIKLLDRTRYDALLLDLDMPGVTGLDVILHVARVAPTMPVVVVTGTYEAERIEGAMAVLAKPIDSLSLGTALADAIRAAAAEQVNQPT